MKEIAKKVDNTEYFLIQLKTDNMCENKDISEIILGKYLDNKLKTYNLRVNSMVNTQFYFSLLLENEFSNSDFKEIELEDLKKIIMNNKKRIGKYFFKGSCNGLEQYIKEDIGA